MTSRYLIRYYLKHRVFCYGAHTAVFALCLMLFTAVLLNGCSSKSEARVQVHRVLVTTVSAQRAGLEARYNGTFMPRTQTPLSFRASGKVASRLVEVGDIVSQGQMIARLDSADYTLAQQAAQQQVLAARADSEQAAREEMRLRSLVVDGTVSHSEYEQVLAKKTASEAVTMQAERQLNLNDNKVRYLVLTAPQSGVISDLHLEVGQVVGEGQPVAMLSDQREMELAVDLPDYMVKDIAQWQATAEVWSADSNLPAQKIGLMLRTVAPVAAGMSQSFQARYRLQGLSANQMMQLKQGMSAQVTLTQHGSPDAAGSAGSPISLPAGAVGKTNGGTFVWVVTPNHHLRQVPVTVLRFTESTVQVTGLTQGMQVVSLGIQNLDEQMTVEAIEQPADDTQHDILDSPVNNPPQLTARAGS